MFLIAQLRTIKPDACSPQFDEPGGDFVATGVRAERGS